MYRVLLIEDDAAMRFLYKKMKIWTEKGFQIVNEAANGRDGLALLEKNRYDLVITDIRMPFVDGIELLRSMKEKGNDTIVVFSSSYNEFEYARQGMILGAFDYILKPVQEMQLGRVLERVQEKLAEQQSFDYLDSVVKEALSMLDHPPASERFASQCGSFLSANYRNGVTMEEMADALGYNKDYFGKLFQQNFGVHFHRFHNMVKVCYAKELIRTGNYKAYEISDMLGFASVDYFTRIFKDIAGITPSAYKASV